MNEYYYYKHIASAFSKNNTGPIQVPPHMPNCCNHTSVSDIVHHTPICIYDSPHTHIYAAHTRIMIQHVSTIENISRHLHNIDIKQMNMRKNGRNNNKKKYDVRDK